MVDLLKEILCNILSNEEIEVSFSNLKPRACLLSPKKCRKTSQKHRRFPAHNEDSRHVLSAAELIELESFKALQKIKTIIEDDSLSDFECIEEIVCVLEALGSSGGNRHDFG